MKKNVFFLSILFLLLVHSLINASPLLDDDYKKILKVAEAYFVKENYNAALPLYMHLDSIEKGVADINYKIGFCYLKSASHKTKAIPYFEEAIKNDSRKYHEGETIPQKAPTLAYYYLAKAYHLNYDFDKAIDMFKKYKDFFGADSKSLFEIEKVNHDIETCNNARELMATPLKVTITNLGEEINSPYPDYSPVISLDEQTLIFTSRRPGDTNNLKDVDGSYFEDIYISHYSNDKWQKAVSIGSNINSTGNEATVNLSSDGQKLLVYKDDEGDGNLYMSELKGETWGTLQDLGANINSASWETHACFSSDNHTLYFVSDKPGGYGGRDIYKCLRLPNGEWGAPQNLGPTINTQYDEDGIFIQADGKQIFFASQGHKSMGGFDIFTSVINDENGNWSPPVNIGYPINTTDDDLFLVTTADGKRAFLTSDKDGGFGEKDIYMLTYYENDPRDITILVGRIINNTSEDISNNSITIIDVQTNETILELNANSSTGKFGTNLPVGTLYKTIYSVKGKEIFSEVFDVPKNKGYVILKREIFYDGKK